ncbi:MAG: hypothetical protein JSS81_08250 [Acidobacteria bacterium]|nr:hypothetical protein [Acidobacteriota bacterium]
MADKIEKIAAALLYEGYLLYPYRKSALKNRQRFNFGLLEPADFYRTQVLFDGPADNVSAELRFLQTCRRQIVDDQGNPLDRAEIEGRLFESWDEVVERRIATGATTDFCFEPEETEETIAGGAARFVRRTGEIKGKIKVLVEKIDARLHRLTVEVENLSPAERLISTHLVLSVRNAVFISLLDYEEPLKERVNQLRQKNLFPVLIEPDVMLASPIILYDYPKIAPESPVDFFDATEIDELLTLRILTLTDAEKREAAALDPRAEKLLKAASETDLSRLHGVFRETEPRIGEKVRLKPTRSADAFDIFLKDRTAIVESVEEDLEGRKHFAVVLENDPGRDLGFEKKIGHRFFFAADELERL